MNSNNISSNIVTGNVGKGVSGSTVTSDKIASTGKVLASGSVVKKPPSANKQNVAVLENARNISKKN
jgi:hypothetical protein